MFKNILKPKEIKNKKSPWDFTAPEYDERSSKFVDAGCNYGVGHNQPVGKEGKASPYSIPKGARSEAA